MHYCTAARRLQFLRRLKGQFFRSYQFFTILFFQLGYLLSLPKDVWPEQIEKFSTKRVFWGKSTIIWLTLEGGLNTQDKSTIATAARILYQLNVTLYRGALVALTVTAPRGTKGIV